MLRENGESEIGDSENRQLYKGVAAETQTNRVVAGTAHELERFCLRWKRETHFYANWND